MLKRIKLSIKKDILNNDGMTLVELIVTFSLVMFIVVGIFSFIMQTRSDLTDKQVMKDLTEYSSTLNNDIHYNLINDKPFVIVYANESPENGGEWTGYCSDKQQPSIQIDSGKIILGDSCGRKFDNLELKCDNYPCAMYGYDSSSTNKVEFKSIELRYLQDANKDADIGVKYNGIFEAAPDLKYIVLKEDSYFSGKSDWAYIDINGGTGYFEINFPYFFDDNNYGFRIAYPFIK